MFAQVSALLAIYFVLWWIVLFATLPFGVRNTAEAVEEAGEFVDVVTKLEQQRHDSATLRLPGI
mgnify:CR=1 FL=1